MAVRATIAVFLLSLLAAGVARADTVELTNGSEIKGRVIEESETRVILEVPGGRIEIPRDRIRRIERGEQALRPTDAGELPPPPGGIRRPPGTTLLLDAERMGHVGVRAKGLGIREVRLTVESRSPPKTPLFLPAGARLVPVPRPGVDPAPVMIVVKPVTLALPGPSWAASVEVASADRRKRIPDEDDEFRVLGCFAAESDLGSLAPLLAPWDFGVRQSAVWIVTDDVDRDDLRQLEWSGVEPASHRPVRGGIAGESTLAAALMLCERAGIDVQHRRAWADRRGPLVAAATPLVAADEMAELCIWARGHLRELGYSGGIREIVVLGLSSERDPDLARHLADVVETRLLPEALPILDRLLADRPPWLGGELGRLERARAALLESPPEPDPGSAGRVGRVTEMLERLRRPDLSERRVGIRALEGVAAEIRAPGERGRIARALLAVLEYGNGLTDLEAARCLLEFRDALEFDAVLRLSRSEAAETRKFSVRLLETRPENEAVGRLRELVEDPETQSAALGALRSRPEVLLAFSDHRDAEVRLFVARCATELPGSDRIRRILLARLGDGDPRVRRVAIGGVAGLPGDDIDRELTRHLRSDADEDARVRAGEALALRLGADALPELEAAVERARTETERAALRGAILEARLKEPGNER